MAVYDVLIHYLESTGQCVIETSVNPISLKNDDSIMFHTLETDASIIFNPWGKLKISGGNCPPGIEQSLYIENNSGKDVYPCPDNQDAVVTMVVTCPMRYYTIPLNCTPVIIVKKTGTVGGELKTKANTKKNTDDNVNQ